MSIETRPSSEPRRVSYQDARKVMEAQAFSSLLGARLTELGDGLAIIEIDVDDRMRQHYGLVHGGVLAYAIDNVTTFAAATVLGPSVLTAGIVANYLRPARRGTIRAEGSVLHHTERLAVCQASVSVRQPDGHTVLCATGQGTIAATGSKAP